MLKFSLLTYIAENFTYVTLSMFCFRTTIYYQLNKGYRIDLHSICMIGTTIDFNTFLPRYTSQFI